MNLPKATVIDLAVKPYSRAQLQRLESLRIDASTGVEGNHNSRRGSRMVTILFKDSWETACAELGIDLPWTTRRANVYVDGILPADCVEKHLQIGDVVLEVTGETQPCEVMEAAEPGLREALEPEWRGGVTCRVLQGGTIKCGDSISVVEAVTA